MWFALVSLAMADDAVCDACCRAGGLDGCAQQLRLVTEATSIELQGSQVAVTGAWLLNCDGTGSFDAEYRVLTDHEPAWGEVLGATNPLALHCFSQACALPEDACLAPNDRGDAVLSGCSDALPIPQPALGRAQSSSRAPLARVVVIDGRPLVVNDVAAEERWVLAAPTAPVAPTPTPSLALPPAPQPAPVTVDWASQPATVALPPPAPVPPPVPAAAELKLPADPPDPCSPAPDAVRGEARKRVGSGDELRLAGRWDDALRDYKAALTLDRCNGFAWMGIGQMANDQGRVDLAIRALKHASRLQPGHPGAWLMLAKAYESFGQRALAAEAYKKSTELAPSNAEAVEGYMRTR